MNNKQSPVTENAYYSVKAKCLQNITLKFPHAEAQRRGGADLLSVGLASCFKEKTRSKDAEGGKRGFDVR